MPKTALEYLQSFPSIKASTFTLEDLEDALEIASLEVTKDCFGNYTNISLAHKAAYDLISSAQEAEGGEVESEKVGDLSIKYKSSSRDENGSRLNYHMSEFKRYKQMVSLGAWNTGLS